MQNIIVTRYEQSDEEDSVSNYWQGYIEPEDLSWIMFVDKEGHVSLFDKRDPATGAVLQ